jgi:hypothetical protein
MVVLFFLDSHSTTQTLTTRTHTRPYKYTHAQFSIWTLVGSVPLDRPAIGLQTQSQYGCIIGITIGTSTNIIQIYM